MSIVFDIESSPSQSRGSVPPQIDTRQIFTSHLFDLQLIHLSAKIQYNAASGKAPWT
jgi:hypothetical protein